MSAAIARLVEQDAIVICCGSGGVGKTTTAAVIAQEAARRGRDAVVVTIHPAKRHALDFLDAPDRLLRMLDNRIFRLLMMPTRAYLRVASVAVQTFLRTVSRVVGTEVVEDIVSFFRAFEGMEAGFRERAGRVRALLAEGGASFVLVTSPRRDAIDEAAFFAQRLESERRGVAALIVNRVHPVFGSELAEGLRLRARELREASSGAPEAAAGTRLAALYDNLADFNEIAARERGHLA